jgi:CHASE2 domain-containing sensor protein
VRDGREHLRDPSRAILAAVGLGALLVLFDPEATGALQRYALPALLVALCLWLTRSVVATGLTFGLLALLNARPGAADAYPGWVLPVAGTLALTAAAVALALRFRETVRETRAERRAARKAREAQREDGDGAD